MNAWTAGWLAAGAFEIAAIVVGAKRKDGTPRSLSSHIWWVRKRGRLGQVLVVALVLWLGWHFVVEG